MSAYVAIKAFEPGPLRRWFVGYAKDTPFEIYLDRTFAGGLAFGKSFVLPVRAGQHTAVVRRVQKGPDEWLHKAYSKGRPQAYGAILTALLPKLRFSVADGQRISLRIGRRATGFHCLKVDEASGAPVDADIYISEHRDDAPVDKREVSMPRLDDARVAIDGNFRIAQRQVETVHVDPGAVVTVRRTDTVERVVVLSDAKAEAGGKINVGVVELHFQQAVRRDPSIEHRTTRSRDIEMTLNGAVASRWEIGCEDHWGSARLETGAGGSVPFEFLIRTHTFARALADDSSALPR